MNEILEPVECPDCGRVFYNIPADDLDVYLGHECKLVEPEEGWEV